MLADERQHLLCSIKNSQNEQVVNIPKKNKTKRKLEDFYSRQSHLIACYQRDSELLQKNDDNERENANEDADANVKNRTFDSVMAKWAFLINVSLLVANATASYLSNSLSVMSTVIDSLMDITSSVVVWITTHAIQATNPYEYPRGRTRLEPISAIIVSIIMGVANLMMIIQSVESVVTNTVNPHVSTPTVTIMLTGMAIKTVLFLICHRRRTSSSTILAMDQRNDIITNFVALIGGSIGTYVWLYADSLGAVIVCSFIAINWFRTAGGQVPLLSGKTASSEFINRIIRVSINHDERIICLDTVIVYHYGARFLVELHVVMSPDTTLKEAHDIFEPLQRKLERLPFVER